ncbi:MAG: lamin tail domain-containing protein [Candidatus Omnitrophota bacterium]
MENYSLNRYAAKQSDEANQSLRLSEFMASNDGSFLDGDGDASDWIEIQNLTDQAVSLIGWHLTDDENDLTKWTFTDASAADLTIPSGGYLIVFASGKEGTDPAQPYYIDSASYLHTNFKLSAAGDSVALISPDGIAVSAYWNFPSQRQGVSYGTDSNNSVGYFTAPTPKKANGSSVFGFIDDTKFSVDRGFYNDPFELEITTGSEGAAIRYTLDGSDPTPANGIDYTQPIAIDKTVVVRAAAFRDGYQPSNVDTQTYLFVADIIKQSPNGEKPGDAWPSPSTGSGGGFGGGGRPGQGGPGGSSGSQAYNYGMDPDVISSSQYADLVDDALLAIPSFSIATSLANLFDTQTGIYANAQQDGIEWERPVSLELLHPDGTKGFQVNAGLRIRGGVSRAGSNPKHNFRLIFRAEYGDAKLKYSLFDDEGAEEFDKIDLRSAQNFSWHYSSPAECTFLYDVFTRDTERDMGKPYKRSRFYHLYIDGQYWGLYQTDERAEASYGASYFGGSSEDYDTIKADNDNGIIYAVDGNLTAYQTLWSEITKGTAKNTDYFRLQGLDADGLTPVPEYPNYLDVDTLIDYMLAIYYGGNQDCPLGPPNSNSRPRNLYAVFNRVNPGGFQFLTHDNEWTLSVSAGVNQNRVNASLGSSLSQKNYFNPWWMHNRLMTDNSEYRLRFADRVYKHFFNNGALTADRCASRFLARKNEIDMAIIAESARWGDYQSANSPRTKDKDWLPMVNKILNNYIKASPTTRTDAVFNQIKSKGWYPKIDPPVFSQHGGIVNPGFAFTMQAAAGSIYYSLNGEDPRLPGGELHSDAILYNGEAIPVERRTRVLARAKDGEIWSALSDAAFGVVNDVKTYLRITEIHYNPSAPSEKEQAAGYANNDDFEFVELANTSADRALDLFGASFSEGIAFDFSQSAVLTLRPGDSLVVTSNLAAFETRYGAGIPIAGIFEGRLDNGGERIQLLDSNGETIHDFTYDDANPWPEAADGKGPSLFVVDVEGNYDDPANWIASGEEGGTPGEWKEGQGETCVGEWNLY